MIKKKREKTYVTNIRDERKNITIDHTNMKKMYYEQFYASEFHNLDEMNKFHKRYKLPKLTQIIE